MSKPISTVTSDRVGTLTGFNPKDLFQAGVDHARKFQTNPLSSSNPDPWVRNEAWRYLGQFTTYNRLVKGTFPGLGIATVAFIGYLGYEQVFAKDEHHGEEHH